MTRVRTLEFLPSIFQTETNSQFLGATLDQLVNPPVTKIIQGYVGSKFGYGIDAKDYYVTEPNKVRRDYQLEPGISFLKNNETTAYDFISYPGILDSLKLQGAITDNNNDLFKSQIYSWDSFTNLDMIINYNQYYWLPDGPPTVTVTASTVFTENDYIVTPLPSAYNIRAVGAGAGSNNPTITLLRGGTYKFIINQSSQFWIQGQPGVSGYSPTQTNLYTRDIYGVDNNGTSQGVVTFTVPQKDAQNEYNYPGNNSVGVVSTRPFSEINGAKLSQIGNIDGITALNGRTVMFYNTGITDEIGYISAFYDTTNYDRNTSTITAPLTIQATQVDGAGVISVSDTANLTVGQTITFTGTGFGGIQPYNPNITGSIDSGSMIVGQKYFISILGTTDWIQAGVAADASLQAEIVGTQLRVNSVLSGSFGIGMVLNGAGVTNGTTITGYDMVATAINGVPTYTVNISQNIPSSVIGVYDLQPGKIFTCANAAPGTGQAINYDPDIYYVKTINTVTNTITISQSLNGPMFLPTGASSGNLTVNINQGLYEQGFYTNVNDYFYTVTFVGDLDDPIIRLRPASLIPLQEKITPQYGTQYVGLHFVKNISGYIERIPYISAPLDTLYYQDGTNPNRVGIIKLIENNDTNTIDVTNDILGKTTYTAKNGVVFTNGLKIAFDGDIVPRSYLQGEYYVEGVGTGIELIPVETLVVPEPFTTLTSNPYDILPWDDGPWDAGLNIPTTPDYITIARNAINKNAWTRSNRWFHIDVISATADYNNNPAILDIYAIPDNKAKRPILEFYPNLKLFNSGIIGKNNVDFIDTRTTNAFDYVENQQCYYPDVQTYTGYNGVINPNNSATNLSNLLPDQYYEIVSLGNTATETWTSLGAELTKDGEFIIGLEYVITTLGTTDWTVITGEPGPFSVGQIITAEHPGDGTGTGEALKTLFLSSGDGTINSSAILSGNSYTIVNFGTTQWPNIGCLPVNSGLLVPSNVYYIWDLGVGTDWNVVAGTVDVVYKVGDKITVASADIGSGTAIPQTFVATNPAVGTGTVVQGNGQVLSRTTTTISIDPQFVNGTFSQGQWINDLIVGGQSRLPTGTRILSINNTNPYQMTVYWPIPTTVTSGTLASFVASTKDNTDLLLFPGARVVFASDTNELVRNKIYNVNFNVTGSTSYPTITLTEAEDGAVVDEDMFSVQRGFDNVGKSFYFDGEYYKSAQQKQTVNQAPLFDVFDENGISYGNQEVYNSSSFNGSKLFNYKIAAGVNDAILGFPISYSSINNVGDISFEVSLYTQTFDYINDGNSITSYINKGFIYNYETRVDYNRLIGWQTSVAPSTQYQIFQFNYVANTPPLVLQPEETFEYKVVLDVPQLSVDETVWPSLQVYNNNNILILDQDYTVENTDTSTIITISLSEDVNTPIQVAILSDKVSQQAYYSIPINLSNNPFNSNPTSVDIGDIRGHYQTIFDNNPNTTGVMFGPNNYRDLGNMVPWGNRIIQNSASLVLPGAFLRNPRHNLYDALLFNSREYIKFKTLLVDTINQFASQQKFDPSAVLDQALDIITSVKSQEQPFFWSDMVPNKAPYISNMYNFANQAETSVFPLSKIYDFKSANYDGVLVYLQRKINGVVVTRQLLRGTEYTVSTTSPSVTVNVFLNSGDKILVKEYNQTYGSYVPNTPTKLGLYPLYVPKILLDTTYAEPTYFIQGHDGSYTKLYGEYNEVFGVPTDFRDQILLEFETRIYNNIKLDRTIPIDSAEIVPGYFRDTTLNYLEFTEIYSKNFLDWVGQNRLDYKTQLYRATDPWTYNYRDTTLKLDDSRTLQGYWRGIYQYVYDTSTPNLTPWAMIGYANKPDWWDERYGPAPWTSDNLILWTDLQDGIDYNGGDPITRPLYARPGLLNIIPVDDQGDLKEPIDVLIANYDSLAFNKKWRVGDDAPVEFSYRKSSTYPFDLMKLQALLKPAAFYNLGADLDNYKYNTEFNQFLVNGRTHLVPADIQIYGNGTAKTSYINWIVDYEKQLGVDATTNIKTLLTNLDVRLVYRLAGFSDKTLLKFFVEKGTPGSRNSSLLIPDESYQVLLYENQPVTRLIYSGVVVQKTPEGYTVFGNSQNSAYFRASRPILNGPKSRITVEDVTVYVADNYSPLVDIIPYGTIFYTPQELSQFLMSYGNWLEVNGAVFDDQIQNVPINWNQMVAEFLYWTQSGFMTGSVITLNPAAQQLTINKESTVVQPLTYNNGNFILNNNLYPIQNKDLSIFRDGTLFRAKPSNEGDAVGYAQFNLSNIEHGIVFQNETLFNDTIYNLISGLKQNRIYVRGTKSGEWNGTLFASGFIYNQDNIEQWNPELKYTKGAIVKYKNKYFTALKIVQPGKKFKEDEWKETDYDEIQKGLLPNSSTRSYESTLYYNSEKANLEKDGDLLSFSLIGFRPREYMASADLTDITQVNVYKNLIKEKGTLAAMKAFKGANLPQGGIDYDIYENWAVLQGTFGGTLNDNFVQFRLNENNITGNPSIVGITNGNDIADAQQLIPIYKFFNYGRPVTDPNILPTISTNVNDAVYPDAGYVNRNDVKMSAYFYSNLASAVDNNGLIVPLSDLYVRDYVWLADYQSSWQVLTPSSIGPIISIRNNLNGTSVVTFSEDHNLNQYDIFAIINFDSAANGYYVATQIVNTRQVLISLALPASVRIITGIGIGLRFKSQRVDQPGDIESTIALTDAENAKNTVWVDENVDGGWAVYRKNIVFKYEKEFNQELSEKFGSAVAYSPLSDYLFSDPALGKVYRYQYDISDGEYAQDEVLTGNVSFGACITHEQNIYAISQPENTPKVVLYTVNDTKVSDNIILYQEILASDIDPAITNFGKSTALSGDLNWFFISDYDATRNKVHVFRRRNELTEAGSFVVGKTYQIVDIGTTDFEKVGAVTNEKGIYFIATGAGLGTGTAKRCDYQYATTITGSTTTTDSFGHSIATNYYGTTLTVGAPDKDHLATNNGYAYIYDRLVQNYDIEQEYLPGDPLEFTLAWTPTVGVPLTVTKNGIEVNSTNYSVVGTTFSYSGTYNIGDILTISGNQFVLIQELSNSGSPRNGSQFGYSVDNNTLATEILIGCPYYLPSRNIEGAAFRYTYGSARFGMMIGTSVVDVTATRQLLINGYLVNIPIGGAAQAAAAINNAKITNVQAQSVNDMLVIGLINMDLAAASQELLISVTDPVTLTELGFTVYTLTQTITDPYALGASQFGTTVKFNEHNSVAISAPVDTRYTTTTFDFVDDENYKNDTIFDNNATQFVDTFKNAGAVYVYDYLGNYNESLSNIGNYTYAQSVNSQNLIYGSQPRYGTALDWSDNKIIIGSPDYRPEDIDGQVVVYVNNTGEKNWIVLRQTSPIVDIDKMYNLQLFSGETNQTLQNLDYMDPLQGKLLGAIQQNIDVISNTDPANYNILTSPGSMVWGEAQLGTIWFDTSNIRYVNYHQNDNNYNAKYWGTLFPGSDIAVYTWVGSTVPPVQYQGPGVPKDVANYTVQTVLNSSNTITPVYYFWARNTGVVFTGKTLADFNIASYIGNPQSSGISYATPIRPDALALYNVKEYINANDTIMQVGFSTGQQDNPAHQEFTLIRTNYADDFLPGVPGTRGYITPESLYDRLLDSLAGVDESGAVVPNPFLPKAVQSGVLARPRQSFFYNRYSAIQNYLQYANTIMALYPISEIRTFNFLNNSGTYYDTKNYWEYINWWAPGYDNNTKAILQVSIYADLSALDVANGSIVSVQQNSNGSLETYRYDGNGVWTRIGLQNGTIRFKDELFDYDAAGYGFGGTFYDTDSFDVYPSEETRWIMRALNEQIYTNDLLIYRNKSLILLFEYIQEETVENQNYLPWLNKTSLVDVSHKVRELKPLQNYVSDNEQFLEGYVNETKPYHVVIKEFLFDYAGTDVYPGMLTDFDLPATYDPTIEKFVTPQLVYSNADTEYEFLPDSPVWQNENYNEWYNNYGISLSGQENYQIAKLESYLTLTTENIIVNNPQSFPINGTIRIGEELINYATVDRDTGIITGLTRGVDGTEVVDHLPGELIYMNLPGVMVFDSGRNYANPPRVFASIDLEKYPAPKQEAVLEAVMALDSVVGINIVDPGQGYAVLPEIVIDPADTFEFSSANVNVINNTIELYAPALNTGDLVRYIAGDINIGGLANKQYYYINVLDSSPTTIAALYTTYADAINDNTRVKLLNQGEGTQTFEFGAKAIPISSSYPIRENNISIRFDRTTYDTQIKDWAPNNFYGSQFVSYVLEAASSDVSLASAQPDINTILSSAEGTAFPLANVANEQDIEWSSFVRTVKSVSSVDSTLVLSYTSSTTDENPSGSTIGFYPGMPIAFEDIPSGNELLNGTNVDGSPRYYVHTVVDLDQFTISTSPTGSALMLASVPSANYKLYTAKITNTAVLSTVYSGYRSVTATYSNDNSIQVELSAIGTNGTKNMYTNLPVFFSKGALGGLINNQIYYVVSLLGSERFTISETTDPVTVRVLQTNAASQIIVENTNGLNVNDPIVFDSIAINNEASDTFGNIAKQTLYYVKSIGINVITITTTPGGATFNTGVVPPSAGNYAIITSQVGVKKLSEDSGNATLVVGLPVSPGQVDGLSFTFYPTSQNYADITVPNLTYGNLLQKTINYTLSADNRIAYDNNTGMYTNIPFQVEANIGGLIAGKTYYAYSLGTIGVECDVTTGSSVTYDASFLGTTMTVTNAAGTGMLYPGTLITGPDVQPNTYVISQLSGTAGGNGTYKVSTTYFIPVVSPACASSTGVISLDPYYTTGQIYVGMPITFTGQALGGILLDFKYYVRHIINSNQFTVSIIQDGSAVSLTTASGVMLASGSPSTKLYLPAGQLIPNDDYLIRTVSNTNWSSLGATYLVSGSSIVPGNYYIIATKSSNSNAFWSAIAGTTLNVNTNTVVYAMNPGVMGINDGTAYLQNFTCNSNPQTGNGQATVVLTDQAGPVTGTQVITSDPTFDIGYVLGGYNVIINNGGTGFTQNNTITIPGTVLGGVSPDNDLTLTVSRINALVSGTYSWSLPRSSNGTITKLIASGTPVGVARSYYLKVASENTFKVYSDPLYQVPVSGINFPYQGFTQSLITGASLTTITLQNASSFNVNDSIIFTNVDPLLNLVEGQTYYVLTKSGNDITVGTNPNGTAISVYSVPPPALYSPVTGSEPTATKPGSFMLLPEPFDFTPSIVRYNNRVWACTVSNNDSEFLFGKWEELRSDDRRLNALDRAKGYYQPTVNMPGMDLTQLFTGLTYPNTTYKGNSFEPNRQYPVDTILLDTPFDPTQANIPAVEWDGTNYIAPANMPNYAAVVADLEVQDDWLISKLANQTLSLTDITKGEDGVYVMSSTNYPTPLFRSTDKTTWSVNGYFVPIGIVEELVDFYKQRLIASNLQFNAVTYDNINKKYLAAGKNIVYSDDASLWYEVYKLPSTINRDILDVAYIETSQFSGYVAVGNNLGAALLLISTDDIYVWQRTQNLIPRTLTGVVSAFDQIFVCGYNGGILKSVDGVNWTQLQPFTYNYNAIKFENNILVLVADNGKVVVSTNGINFVEKATGTTENLNDVMYVAERGQWTIVGNNNTVLQTQNITATPVVWDRTHVFSSPDPDYTVQGDPFQAGYGPEEMVPGIVSDQLTMIVNTRAGTNWPSTEYAHVGYNVISIELDQTATNKYSFNEIVQTPAYINVFLSNDGLSTTWYEGLDYTVDWVNKVITPTTALSSGEQLRVDVYEVGNGDQLVKSNTETDPIERNSVTGFDEIYLDCNYTNLGFDGSGIVQPDSYPISVTASETESGTDFITVSDVTNFTLNGEIYFAGAVFGGVTANTTYYVKSINTVRSTITISASLVSGVAGPILPLTTDTGFMNVVIQRTSGQFFTEPAVFLNGTKLVSGLTNYVIATSSATHALTTFSTAGLVVDQPIVFSDTIFGGIVPRTTYYVYQILSPTQFMIRDGAGDPIYLSNASGSAIFITNDYAATLAENQITAKIIFAERYNKAQDYISYSFFGPTDPQQYGFTIPQTQQFMGQGSVGPYALDNYLGGVNPTNAIVEVNGLRIHPSEYNIYFAHSTLVFVSMAPSPTDVIAVTTYNDTQRQYLFTNTFTGQQVTPISYINNVLIPAAVTTSIPHGLSTDDVVRIDGVSGSTQLNDQRFIINVTSPTTFELYEYVPGTPASSSVPIADVDTYNGDGYVWLSGSYILENKIATSSSYDVLMQSWTITVDEIDGIIPDTPVYFTEDGVELGSLTSIPQIVAGQRYFIKEINEFTNEFSITDIYGGSAMILSAVGSCSIRVTQWEQFNTDRLWVTVNGKRVSSNDLRLNEANEVSILTEILPSDDVVITSMMPSATPDSQTYIQTVSQDGVGKVFRANTETRTWLTHNVGEFSDTIQVDDVRRLTNSSTQTNTTPAAILGYHEIGLTANRFDILQVRVYNNNPDRLGYIDDDYIIVRVSGLGPFVFIQEGEWIEAGDQLTITTLEGKIIYVNGEYMQILNVDEQNNILNVQRGAMGSIVNVHIPKYSTVYSLLEANRMSEINYQETWNPIPGIYNATQGDPLQIAESSGASFLRVDIT